MLCWICCKKTEKYILFPEMDDDFIEPIYKDTYIVKEIDRFKFLYYIFCYNCLDEYLNKCGRCFKYIKDREIGIKNK